MNKRRPDIISEKTRKSIPKIPSQGRIALILRERINFRVLRSFEEYFLN